MEDIYKWTQADDATSLANDLERSYTYKTTY